MKKIYLYISLLGILFFANIPSAMSQVNVNATAGVPVGAYPNISAAFTAINAGTHQGMIFISITANVIEPGSAVLNSSGAGPTLYQSVRIFPVSDGILVSGTTAAGRGLIELNGADSVIIDGDNPLTGGTNQNLTFTNTAASTVNYTSVIRIALSTLVTSGNTNTVRNCILNGSATGRNTAAFTSTTGPENTTYGLLVGGGASTVDPSTAPSAIASVTTVVGAGITATAFVANNNMINVCARGIAVQGSSTTVANNLSITNNVIGSATAGNTTTVYSRGMTLQGFDNAMISGNTIRNIEWFVTSATMGIALGDASATGTNAIIEKNTIAGMNNNNTGTYGAYGINVNCGPNQTMRNNFIYGITGNMQGGAAFSTTFGLFGIRVSGSTNHKIYNNSVSMSGLRAGTPATSLLAACCAIVNTGQTGMDIRNNIFSNTMTGGTTQLAYVSLYLPVGGTSAMNLTLNNNAYYCGPTAASQGIAQVSTTSSVANLYLPGNFNPGSTAPATNLRAYTSTLSVAGTNDNASYASSNAAPFISLTNLHLDLASLELPNVEQKGDATVPVAVDFDNDVRPNVSTVLPDIGADEVAVAACSSASGGTIAPSSYTRCENQTVNLVSTGATTGTGITYQWMVSTVSGGPYVNVSGGTGANSTSYTSGPLTPAGTYFYVLQTTCSFGPIVGLSNEATVTVNTLPVVGVSPSVSSYCTPGGAPVTLTATGASTYSWGPAAGLSATTGAIVDATPAVGTTYTVTGTDGNGCTATATALVNVSTMPTAFATANPATICPGSNSLLIGSGSFSFNYCQPVYTNGTGFGDFVSLVQLNTLNNPTGASAAPYYTLYPASGSTTTTLVAGNSYTITLSPGTYTINDLAAWIDYNQNGILNDPGEKLGETDNLGAMPATTAFNFTVPAGAFNGTTRLRVRDVDHATTNDMDPCAAQSTYGETEDYIITIVGGADPFASYAWTPSTFLTTTTNDTTNAVGVTSTTTYIFSATSAGGCTDTASVTVLIDPLSSTNSATPNDTVCETTSLTLNSIPSAGGAPYSFSWSGPNSFTSTSQNPVIPAITLADAGVYTVTVTDNCGSMSTTTLTITVNPAPSISVSPNVASYCTPGPAVTLTASGSSVSYSWAPAAGLSATTGSTVDASPSAPTVYIVTGTGANGCLNSDTATIASGGFPTASATATPSWICPGDSSQLIGVGSPAAFTYCQPVYGTGTGFGDYISLVQLDNINNATVGEPTPYYILYPAAGSTTTTLVAGSSYNITLSPGTYNINDVAAWIDFNMNGVLNDAGEKLGETDDLGAAPATTVFNFTVPVNAINGPTRLRVRDVDHAGTNDMDPCAPQSVYGETEDYIVTIVGGVDAMTYSWSPSTFLSSTTNDTVAANGVTSTTNYIFTAITDQGCTTNDTVAVNTFTLPSVVANATSTSICPADSVTLYGTGATSYSWDNGVVDSVGFVPASTLTYIVVGTDTNSCVNMDTITVTVNPLPTVGYTATPNDTVCPGGSVTLSGTGATSYVWSGGITNGVSFNPGSSTTYTVTGTDANGCMNTATAPIVVGTNPTVNLGADIVQANPPAVLDAGAGFTSYLWSTTETTQTISVNANGTYIVTVTNIFGCTDSDTIQVNFTSGISNPDGSTTTMMLYPNPNTGPFNVRIDNLETNNLVLDVLDMTGRVVHQLYVGSVSGNTILPFDLTNLRVGTYVLRMTANGSSTQLRFIIHK